MAVVGRRRHESPLTAKLLGAVAAGADGAAAEPEAAAATFEAEELLLTQIQKMSNNKKRRVSGRVQQLYAERRGCT